ncbi:MAG: 2-oxoacid:acceptor oxidoreductase subunit alpha, partial [Bacteroidia bacterium]
AHVKYLNPFPKNLGGILKNFDKVLIPEMNNGQLIKVIRDKYFIDAKGLNKIKGMPFSSAEIKNKIIEMLDTNYK